MNLAAITFPLARMFVWGRDMCISALTSVFHPAAGPAFSANLAPADWPADVQAEAVRRSLQAVLEAQVVPRLLQSQRLDAACRSSCPSAFLAADLIADFALACARADREAAERIIAQLQAQGFDHESVLVDLVGPAANELGRQWDDDRLAFTDVTIGLSFMRTMVHPMDDCRPLPPHGMGRGKRVLLASAPGSQHMLGPAIVAEFFHQADWQVVLEVTGSTEALCQAVRDDAFDLIGLSVSLDNQLEALPGLITALRTVAGNPRLPVLLGGPAFTRHHAAARFGAQAICTDARDAVPLALSALAEQAGRERLSAVGQRQV